MAGITEEDVDNMKPGVVFRYLTLLGEDTTVFSATKKARADLKGKIRTSDKPIPRDLKEWETRIDMSNVSWTNGEETLPKTPVVSQQQRKNRFSGVFNPTNRRRVHPADGDGGGGATQQQQELEAQANESTETPDLVQRGRLNTFAQQKSWAQGFLDVALIMANVTQMKLLIFQGHAGQEALFASMMALLALSIILQLVVGMLLLWKTRQNVEDPDENHQRAVDRCNNWATGLVLIITVLNLFITAFLGPGPTPTSPPTASVLTTPVPTVPSASTSTS